MMTDEAIFRVNENELKYSIKIASFIEKMRTWRVGREVQSLPFILGETEFHISVYPNGNDYDDYDTQGYVSLFVHNRSDWNVTVELEFAIGRMVEGGPGDIESNESFGYSLFYDHQSLESDGEALYEDGTLEVVVVLSLLWEEVTEERKDVKVLLKESKAEVAVLKKKMETLTSKVDSNAGLMLNLEKSFTSKFRALELSFKKCSLPCPECPVCFEEMKPPVRIVQCRSGHLVCQQCGDRPQVLSCPTCKQEFTGRAIGMENHLRTLFG
eukprot:GFUD01020529.1.p1 GENE.GFUD01020529.1~~GFUD01020529.1.p1  ORF type:complete len:269 (+),score=65.41 GFUD01020529.1:57-863(+)